MGDINIAWILELLMWITALGFSVMFHEISHGWVALKLGDPTAKNDGRLTFNPIKHIDPWMTIALPVILLISTGFMFGGAKPVQINPLNFKNPGLGMAISAAAGPISNFFLATVSFLLLLGIYHVAPGYLYGESGGQTHLTLNSQFLGIMIFLNLLLGAFNLIPIPPLDGSRVLRYILPVEGKKGLDRIEPYGLFLLLPFIFLGYYRYFLLPFFGLFKLALRLSFDPEFAQAVYQKFLGPILG